MAQQFRTGGSRRTGIVALPDRNIHEEQLKGRFNIKSDKHSISNNVHKMELELVYFGTPENIDTTETDDTNNTGGD